MQLPEAAYPIPELWADNEIWATAWRWLHRRRPQGFDLGWITEESVAAYAARQGLDAQELALAMDRVDEAFFHWREKQQKKKG